MPNKTQRDLFGRERKVRRPAYESALEREDASTVAERAGRVRWLKKVLPKGGMAMPSDSFFVFSEMRSTFVDGYFVATVVLAAAFAEHWMSGVLTSKGFGKDAERGLGSCINCGRRYQVWPDLILNRLDHLRQIRNPFVHLKEFGHPYGLSQRSWMKQRDPAEVLEEDARQALESVLALVSN